jgi:hypothetical protein
VEYGELHLKRVRLVRALLETGGLSIAAAKAVIRVLDADEATLADTISVTAQAMGTPRSSRSVPSAMARERVLSLARSQGWTFVEDNPGIDDAARALDGLNAIDFTAPDEYLVSYANAATAAASADIEALASLTGRDEVAKLMVVGTVLGVPLFSGLRRIAHEDAAQHHLGADTTLRD